MARHHSYDLCRELAGVCPDGSVADLADRIAECLENAEAPADQHVSGHPVSEALAMVARIRSVMDRAEKRLRELGES